MELSGGLIDLQVFECMCMSCLANSRLGCCGRVHLFSPTLECVCACFVFDSSCLVQSVDFSERSGTPVGRGCGQCVWREKNFISVYHISIVVHFYVFFFLCTSANVICRFLYIIVLSCSYSLVCFMLTRVGSMLVKLYEEVRHSKTCILRLGHFVMNKMALICGLVRLLGELCAAVC